MTSDDRLDTHSTEFMFCLIKCLRFKISFYRHRRSKTAIMADFVDEEAEVSDRTSSEDEGGSASDSSARQVVKKKKKEKKKRKIVDSDDEEEEEDEGTIVI